MPKVQKESGGNSLATAQRTKAKENTRTEKSSEQLPSRADPAKRAALSDLVQARGDSRDQHPYHHRYNRLHRHHRQHRQHDEC